jgi:hypothetical protein
VKQENGTLLRHLRAISVPIAADRQSILLSKELW